jgi:hypothetical protein
LKPAPPPSRAPAPAVPKDEPARPAAPVKPLALLAALESLVARELGPLEAGVRPLLDDLRQGLLALDPPGDGMLPSPQEQEKLRAKLDATIAEAEDVLEALQLAARRGGGSG